MNSNLDPHIQLEEWLVDGAVNDPPREMAFHASMCDECLSRLNAFDSLAAVDVGAAGSPPPLARPDPGGGGPRLGAAGHRRRGRHPGPPPGLRRREPAHRFRGSCKQTGCLPGRRGQRHRDADRWRTDRDLWAGPGHRAKSQRRSYPHADPDVHPAALRGAATLPRSRDPMPPRSTSRAWRRPRSPSAGPPAATAARSRSGRSGVPRAPVLAEDGELGAGAREYARAG